MRISKKKHIELWLNDIRPFGDVLEIGSGPSLRVQAFHPKSYTHIGLLEWHTKLPSLGTFDFILYNGPVIEQAHVEMGNLILKEGKKTLQKIQETVPDLTKIRYLDKDLDAFAEQIGKGQKPYLARFVSELLENGQITEAQYQRQIEKHHLKKTAPKKAIRLEDHLFECIQECLKHMHKGSRFSCLIGVLSKYEDPKFFEHLITNPSLDYQEKAVNSSNYLLIEML